MPENSDLDLVLDAIGDRTRRSTLVLLRERPSSVGVLASHLPISRPAVSKHLRVLQEAGLVGYFEQGTHNIFYLQPTGFQAARAFLELFWDEALFSFKQFSEESDPPSA